MDQARQGLPGWIVPAIMVAASFAVFLPVLNAGLLSDDHVAVWRSGVHGVPWSGGFFRPLSDLTIELGHMVHGVDAAGYRSFDLLIHGINAWLVFLLFRQWAGREQLTGAWLAAGLFLVYPFHLESIIWIVGRNSSLATAFLLIALLSLGSRMKEPARILLSTVAFCAGLLSYESMLLLPLFLLPMWRRFPTPAVVTLLIAWGMAAGLYVLLRWQDLTEITGTYGGAFLGHAPGDRLLNIPKVLMRMFLPPQEDPRMRLVSFILLTFILIAAAWSMKRLVEKDPSNRQPLRLMLACLAISAILPVFAGVSTRTSESDRFLYMPSVFLAMILSFTILKAATARWVGYLIAGGAALYFLVFLHLGQRNWMTASRISYEVLSGIPEPPPDGRLIVVDLPDSYRGAFIFRNGFAEAMQLRGFEVANVVEARRHPVDPTLLIESRSGRTLRTEEGDLIHEVGAP